MIADLKPYPEMKDSGVPWLGEVPEHWEVRRLGALVRERGETNDDNNVTDVLSVMRERGVIPYAEKGNVGNKKSDDITRYKIVRPNDIVVNCMNVIIGSVGLSKYTGCLSPVYYVLTRRAEIDDSRYLNAYFQTKPFQLSLVRIGNGILAHRMRIPMELLKCEPFPRPPAAEQAAIVRFLDYMDRRIGKYIRAKQKLIKLLEEQKQAIIHRAVTRGLPSTSSGQAT
ncbi:MAG: restriction endonuclease subunit S, partial [Smithellaceae bacterium]|nr:restriction endonuclease subunit S [Smithellaceae bacterium]